MRNMYVISIYQYHREENINLISILIFANIAIPSVYLYHHKTYICNDCTLCASLDVIHVLAPYLSWLQTIREKAMRCDSRLWVILCCLCCFMRQISRVSHLKSSSGRRRNYAWEKGNIAVRKFDKDWFLSIDQFYRLSIRILKYRSLSIVFVYFIQNLSLPYEKFSFIFYKLKNFLHVFFEFHWISPAYLKFPKIFPTINLFKTTQFFRNIFSKFSLLKFV